MRIIVLIKQVPESTEVRINPETNTLIREGVKSIINPFDTYALEEGVLIKERLGGTVVVMTMGPPQAREALQDAIALGADEAILLSDRAFAGADTLATSRALAAAVRKLEPYDLIICGKQAIDGDTAQVGPEVAEFLDIPHVTYVRKVRELEPGRAVVERMVEGAVETVEMSLPGLITVVKDINQPRIPSLKGIMKARRATIPVWTPADVGLPEEVVGLRGSPTAVEKVFVPQVERRGEVIEGSPEEVAEVLLSRLQSVGVL
ncbi:MAG: electron transfer flavoprotein subunit beta/FixA family protein [Firmicutes bacterium]|nr:electron transfer flavoprotein subunit beta/FixA family protein [Bacillota bacterium]